MKKIKALLIVIIIVSMIVMMLGVFLALSKNFIFSSLPSSYICNQISKDILIGTSSDDVLEYIKQHEKWEIIKHCEDCDTILSCEGVICGASSAKSFYSLNRIETDENGIIYMPGDYYIAVKLGTTFGEPFWGKVTYADFIFDENLNLINIIIYKSLIGF